MKQLIFWSILFFLMSLFFSCRSVKSIEVETYNPARITFPPEVKTLMIVNNSAQQPDNVGHRYMRANMRDSLMSVSADSTAYDFCLWLGKNMAESPIFDDVRLCEDTLRRDSVFYDKRPFSAGTVRKLCDSYGVDGLISLDNMYFITKVYDTGAKDWLAGSIIKVEVTGELRALWPNQKEVYAFPFSDTLKWYWSDQIHFPGYVEVEVKPDVKEAMRYLSGVVAEKMHVNFVPYWSFENRWYYTSISSEWKRGTVYADAGKWEEALTAWELLLPKTVRKKLRARLLSNLALCNEMTGSFEKAIDYAEKASQLFEEYAGEYDQYTKLQKKYVEVLKERVKNDAVLSRQLRETVHNEQP